MDYLKCCPFCGKLPTTCFRVSSMGLECGDIVDFEIVCPYCRTNKTVRLKIQNGNSNFMEVEKSMQKVKDVWNARWDEKEA